MRVKRGGSSASTHTCACLRACVYVCAHWPAGRQLPEPAQLNGASQYGCLGGPRLALPCRACLPGPAARVGPPHALPRTHRPPLTAHPPGVPLGGCTVGVAPQGAATGLLLLLLLLGSSAAAPPGCCAAARACP